MPRYNRKESYQKVHNDLSGTEGENTTIQSPFESDPKKFALVCFDSEENDANAFITTHKTLNDVVAHIEEDESDFAPSYVVDLDNGQSWEPEFQCQLVKGDPDYFAEETEEEPPS